MKKIKRISALLLTLLMIISLTGCMPLGKIIENFTEEKMTVEKLVQIYNEKYDDQFEFLESGLSTWTDDYDAIVLWSTKLSSKILVRYYMSGEHKGKMVDNYIAVKYKTKVDETMQPILEEIYGECHVSSDPPYVIWDLDDPYPPDIDFDSYVSNYNSCIYLDIPVNKSKETAKEDAVALFEKLKEKNIILQNATFFYYDVEDINEIEKTNDYFRPYKPLAENTNRLSISIDRDYNIKFSGGMSNE